MSGADTMRLDRFLWFARLAKTRDVAQALASNGHLRLDGRAIDRSHARVRVGNILTFFHGGRVRVLRLPSPKASPEAGRNRQARPLDVREHERLHAVLFCRDRELVE